MKIFSHRKCGEQYPTPFKILLIMKLTLVLMVIFILQASAEGYAQKITISQKNASLEQVFWSISNQSEYEFVYDAEMLKEAKPVDVKFKNSTLEDVLNQCFSNQSLTYTIHDNIVTVKRKSDLILQSKLSDLNSPANKNRQDTIRGRITDANGDGLPGATIRIKGKNRGTSAQANGSYAIEAESNEVLVFAFIGMKTQEVLVGSRTSINISLKEDIGSLQEIVVVGYGEVAKIDLTGSVGVVNMKDLTRAPVGTFVEALAGRVAGVKVSSADGQPGGEYNITIRGVSSLTQSSAPLFIVDGFPLESTPTTLNPEEIESLTILKDAASTAIYGSRGANGVVVIQTKRGKVGKPVVSINSSVGYQMVPKPIPMMNAYEYVSYQQEVDPDGRAAKAFLANGKTLESYKDSASIDFQDYVMRTGVVQIHDIALRGGTDQTRYSISGRMFDQQGVIVYTGNRNYSGRITLDQNISNKIKTGITANYASSTSNGKPINTGADNNNNPRQFILKRVWSRPPITPFIGEDILNDVNDGTSPTSNDLDQNPFVDLQNQYSVDRTSPFSANGYVEYAIIKDLTFKSTAGISLGNLVSERFYNHLTTEGSPQNRNNNRGVWGTLNNSRSTGFFNDNTINFKRTIHKDHIISAMGLFGINTMKYSRNGHGASFIPNEALGMSGLDEGTPFSISASSSENTMMSYGGRLDYNYKSKYIITGTFRADGSSKFLQPWGYFPGAAVAWNMQKEGFFTSLLPVISTSKLRLSYGSTGNNRVGDFAYLPLLTHSIQGYPFNGQPPVYGTINVSDVGNSALQWEKVTTLDMGYEIGILDGKISLEVDMYRKNTENLLLNATLPPSTGFTSAIKNIGKLRNDGLEFTLNTNNISTPSFSWQSNFNISFNRNEIRQLTRGEQFLANNASYATNYNRPLYMSEVGGPAGMMIGYLWDGNYQFEDFDNPAPGVYVLKANVAGNGQPLRSDIQPGDIKYKDLNHDGIMDNADVAYIGNGNPKHIGGFSNNIQYKGFGLNVFFQWSSGNDIYNANRIAFEGSVHRRDNQYKSYVNRWTPTNPTNENYRATGGDIQNRGFHSSKVVEDGSFLRLKTLEFGYTVPSKLIKQFYLSNLSLNIAAQNVVTWTNYSGLDPEVSTRNSVLTPGFDFSAYPRSPTVVFALKAAF